MPQFLRKGPSKKEAYVPKGTVEKPLENSESLRYKALENKVFYFDFKNTGTAAWLEKEIRKLGGRVEYFFGKDVHYLITDKPQTRDSLPPSPFSTAGPSPFSRPDTSQSRCEAGPSVGPSEWAYSEQWKKPTQSSQRSRASKMMEMASVTKSQGSCDMFARAKERGTAIKTVEQITSWLHTVHKKLGTKMSRDSLKEPAKNPSRKLRGQYMKIEDSSRKYKPQVLEDTASWQVMDLNTLSDDSPFNTKQRAARKAVEKPSTIMSILKKEVKDAKMKSKRPLVLRRKGGGKCEGCNVRFEDLESHLAGDQHGKYAKKDKHFEQIDQLISEGLNLDTFLMDLRSRKKSAVDKKVATLKGTLSPRSDGSTDTLDVAEGPCTRSRRQKISNMPSPAVTASMTAIAPSPKLPGGALSDLPGELENNYYLRSTPRKLAVLLDQWDSTWDVLPTPENQSQASVAGQVEDFAVKRAKLQAAEPIPGSIPRPTFAAPLHHTTTTPSVQPPKSPSSPSRSRQNSKKFASPVPSRVNNSPSKRSPRIKEMASTKRRLVNHS